MSRIYTPRFLLAFLSILSMVSTVESQIVPDTLDARRYLPLEVGNEWHFVENDFASPIEIYTRSKIVSDTLAHGRQYFQMDVDVFWYGFTHQHSYTHFYRYNSIDVPVGVPRISGTTAQDSSSTWFNSSFGDSLLYDNRLGYYALVEGGYDSTYALPNGSSVRTAAVKEFSFGGIDHDGYNYGTRRWETYAADIGLIFRAQFDGPSGYLHYAKIGDRHYGTRVFPVNIKDKRPIVGQLQLELFPNPSKTVLHARFPSSGRIEVFDILGRSVYYRQTAGQEESISVEHWKAGVYFLKFTNPVGRYVTERFVVSD